MEEPSDGKDFDTRAGQCADREEASEQARRKSVC